MNLTVYKKKCAELATYIDSQSDTTDLSHELKMARAALNDAYEQKNANMVATFLAIVDKLSSSHHKRSISSGTLISQPAARQMVSEIFTSLLPIAKKIIADEIDHDTAERLSPIINSAWISIADTTFAKAGELNRKLIDA